MKIEKININEIKPYENNAKLHPEWQIEQIKESIEQFGNNDPIAVDENNVIIEGHGRYEALKELGYEEVEIIRLSHMSEEEKKAYMLVHNKLTMNSGFDDDILEQELADLYDADFDLDDFGFQEDEYEFESFIDNLLEEDYIGSEAEKTEFAVTFVFPIEYKELMDAYLKANKKESIVDLILQEITREGK